MSDSTTGAAVNIWPNYSSINQNNANAKDKGPLGKDDFLKILVAQLKNQDPMQPLDDKEFITQMAQFSSVEQIMNMSNEMKLLRQSIGIASDLIGKSIEWTAADPTTGETSTKDGVVDSIKFKDGIQYASVEGEEIPLDQITKVSNQEVNS